MGGAGPGTTTNPQTGVVSSAPVLQGTSPLDSFNGSRQAVADQAQTAIANQGITGILQANPAYADAWAQYTNALAMNPTAPPVSTDGMATPVGFNSDAYGGAMIGDGTGVAEAAAAASGDTSGLPHLGADIVAARQAAAEQAQAQTQAAADAKAAADAAAAKSDANKPITETGTKIWPPADPNQDVRVWLAANPHWATAVEVPDKGPIGTPGNSWYQPKGSPL